jgi:DNA polymerase-3 subunit gamma/tau
VWSRDSIEAVALGNPLVRQAQELFHAEVRSVLDLRDNQGNDSRSKG